MFKCIIIIFYASETKNIKKYFKQDQIQINYPLQFQQTNNAHVFSDFFKVLSLRTNARMVLFSGSSVLNTMSEDLLNYIPTPTTSEKSKVVTTVEKKEVKQLKCDHQSSVCDVCNKENIPPNQVKAQKKRKSLRSSAKRRNLMRL